MSCANAELEAKHHQHIDQVVLRGDVVKDDSGSYAVLTDQGSSASQMTTAKVMDIISRLPRCAGQAADAVSVYTQVKMEDAHPLLIQNRSVQTFGFVYHDTNGRNHGPVWKTQLFFLREICTVILWQDYYGKGNLRSMAGRKFQIGNAYSYIIKRIILICVCGWRKIGWKETKPWSDVETTPQRSRFGRTNIFPWSCILGLHSKRQCEVSQDIVDNHRTMFESRISAVRTEKLPFTQNLRISSWSYDMEGHAKKCVERYCELANKTTQQLCKVSTPCIDDTTSKKKKWNLLENCHKYALKLFWNACTWHVLWDLIFYGQWTNLHDQSQNGPKPVTNAWIDWFIKFITHVNTINIVMWVILQNNADWDCFNTLTSREILKIQNPLLEEHCEFLEVIHLFQ